MELRVDIFKNNQGMLLGKGALKNAYYWNRSLFKRSALHAFNIKKIDLGIASRLFSMS